MPSDNEGRQKRVTVRAACEECRLRKTKCDGARPGCGRCETRRQPCVYSTGPEESRNEALRRTWQAREEQFHSLLSILNLLQSGTEEQALIVLQHIRSAANISSPAAPPDAQSIESLRKLSSDAQAVTAGVTSPVLGTSTSTYSRAGSEASRKPSRLTLSYIVNNDGAPEASATSNRRASASDTHSIACQTSKSSWASGNAEPIIAQTTGRQAQI
ncbi:hypothetical protein AC579_6332 [Pseudocercospora musae]|uniref:Zn(2)-C6 fungal-type domain-containing protein n=1 Tax=Pseudocercospora musae TaxID=113226 RepID=A0A139H8A5_9PEZI|nr:hypothetical protein AC579_6332 [Pseudocercospora musae]